MPSSRSCGPTSGGPSSMTSWRVSSGSPTPSHRRRGTGTDMHLTDLDDALERLRAATDRAGANLLELDQSPSRALLAAARLEGESAQRWPEAEAVLAGLFQSYSALSAAVEAAVAVRGSGSTVPP